MQCPLTPCVPIAHGLRAAEDSRDKVFVSKPQTRCPQMGSNLDVLRPPGVRNLLGKLRGLRGTKGTNTCGPRWFCSGTLQEAHSSPSYNVSEPARPVRVSPIPSPVLRTALPGYLAAVSPPPPPTCQARTQGSERLSDLLQPTQPGLHNATPGVERLQTTPGGWAPRLALWPVLWPGSPPAPLPVGPWAAMSS